MKQKHQFTENDRDLILQYLNSMGVALPPKTKLPIKELDRKLTKALDSTQRFTKLLPDHYLDPTGFRQWNPKEDGSTLNSATRSNVRENLMDKQRVLLGVEESRLYNDVFYDLRQTVMAFGNNYDNGHRVGIVQDKEEKSTILFRVIDVLFLKANTPVFVFLFHHVFNGYSEMDPLDFIESHSEEQGQYFRVTATILEQRLFLRLLRLNSTRVGDSYSPKRFPLEDDFELSFLLPLGPPAQVDIGKLVEYTGCVMCGEPNRSKCSSCMSQSYCSKECQKSDWPEHKKMCKSITGGKWIDVTFSKFPKHKHLEDPEKPAMVWAHMNQFQASDEPYALSSNDNSDPVPVHAYGSRPFIIKIQLSFDQPDLLLYDRRRTIHVHITPDIDEKGFYEVAEAVIDSPLKAKMYRWARRTGDLTLSVCLDKEPVGDTKW